MSLLSRLLKWLLVLLLLANLVAAAAWLARPVLRQQGLLPPVPPARVEALSLALPPATALGEGGATPEPTAPEATRPAAIETAAEAPAVGPAPAPPGSATPAPSPPAQPLPEPPSASMPCAMVGPFADQAEAQAARQAIERAGGTAQLQPQEEADYLVFVPPAPSTEAAAATRLALRRQGLDAYVIPAGEYRDGVSVGVFRDRQLAEAQQRRAAEAGHPAQLQRRERPTTYRLLAQAPAAALAGLPQAACEKPAEAM